VTAAACHNGSAVPLHPFESRQKTSRSHTIASKLYHEAQNLDDFAGRCGDQIRGEWKDGTSAANPMQPESQVLALRACYYDTGTVSRKYATEGMPVTA